MTLLPAALFSRGCDATCRELVHVAGPALRGRCVLTHVCTLRAHVCTYARADQVMGSRYVEVFRSTRMEMEQARMHAMAMRPPHMQHHHGAQHHGGQHGGHGHGGHNGHAQHGGHGGQQHGGYGAHHAAAHGGHAQHKGGQHGGESAHV